MGILVVDDNQANLFVIQHILKRAGYKDLLTFSSAKDMFQHLQGYSPFSADIKADVILMDIMMPEMDGIEACRRLQQIPHLKDIPVIFVTALEDSNKVAEALDAGGTDYVMKPINKTELLARIRAALRLKYEKDWHKEQENKIKNELDLSMQVQTSMLSEPIYNEHTLLKASYLPANKLAGDMYYWHQIDEHRYAAIQLDMMGHGISASLVCMFISSVLRDAIRTCSDPEYVMKELNRWMNSLNQRNQRIPYYFTAIYLVLNKKDRTIEKGFFSACHNVILCIELHFLQRDYSALCLFKHLFIDVCGVYLRSFTQPLFFHQNRHGVGFFPSRTACMPNSDFRQFSEHRDNLISKSLKKGRVPEHFCNIN